MNSSDWVVVGGIVCVVLVIFCVILAATGVKTVQGTTYTDSGYKVYKHCIDGVMYYSASTNLALAIDAETGKPIICD